MKKIFILILFIGLPIMIYLMTVDNKVYYVALGDSLATGQSPYGKTGYGYTDYVAKYLKSKNKLAFYTKSFAVNEYRTTDLINDINDNRKIYIGNQSITLKHALTKADVVTISIGNNDLFYKLGINSLDSAYYSESDLDKYVDEVIIDIEKLVIITKKYCKEDIILLGYYNPLWHMKKNYAKELDPVFAYANSKMINLSKKYDLYYVNTYDLMSQNIKFFPNPLDTHPNSDGYKAISKQVINVINNHLLN